MTVKRAKKDAKKTAAAKAAKKPPRKVAPPPPENGDDEPVVVSLRAKVTGWVNVRLRVYDPAFTAEKLAKLLNGGNATWDVGDPARYHRIAKDGRIIAEIEQADEELHWENYRPE